MQELIAKLSHRLDVSTIRPVEIRARRWVPTWAGTCGPPATGEEPLPPERLFHPIRPDQGRAAGERAPETVTGGALKTYEG
jgi:hypothetical protein